ncbi:putative mitochondrial ribosomal protein DAP3 [Xylona heveae TC161]|uniref:Small ribosomal subunit protein mS29 n=1 Tax=Xylona heveae (strain CBS 132557 / TC161) TaxID=1328760 RepID=A0A165JZA5_XYLHT|nr:putative mitochondrial ribosomal protein DAP3 [Xylona heveae TC161]KZF26817.1 putative mitochondrial ribosomal protein DAP3 [Xylona heveae TC161]
MASSSCWRCLLRPQTYASRPSAFLPSTGTTASPFLSRAVTPAIPFSTSSPYNAAKAPAKGGNISRVQAGPPRRGQKSLRIKKKSPVKATTRPPAPGERKAARKRIVLSNTNAVEVQGLKELSPETMVDAQNHGQVLGIPGPVVDQLRAVEAFKTTQAWKLFRQPSTLQTKQSLDLAQQVAKVTDGENGKRTFLRKILTGDKASGKSVLLLQAMAMAFLKGWVVISIPDAQELTIAHTAYSPLRNTEPKQYVQKAYMSELLSRTLRANQPVLNGLQLSQEHPGMPVPLQSNMTLARLAELGAKDADLAWPAFQALWTELSAAPANAPARPPVMLAIDNLAHVMRNSAYRDADFNLIHAHDLAIVNHFVKHLSGEKTLPQGGAIVAATSASNTPLTPTMTLALRQIEARAAGTPEKDLPQPSAWEPVDERVKQVFAARGGIDVHTLSKVSREEARGLLEYYAASGLLRAAVNDSLVAEKWILAGGGIVGELERGAVTMRV